MARRILIVEPDPKTSQDLFVLFQSPPRLPVGRQERGTREQYEPQVATCLAHALEKARTIRFHCVILDVNLPEMKGYEAVPLVRTINNNPPIIMVAAENSPELEVRVRQQDVFYYHLTSFDQNELRLAVENIFEKLPALEDAAAPSRAAARPIQLMPLQSFRAEHK